MSELHDVKTENKELKHLLERAANLLSKAPKYMWHRTKLVETINKVLKGEQ